MDKQVFPRGMFPEPKRDADGNPEWQFMEEPLNKKLLDMEVQSSEALRKALSNNLTEDFITSLYYKAIRKPPEVIIMEIKGEVRSGKSTAGIFLGNLISHWWGHEFTEENILANQNELLYKLKDAKFGETFVVDEQVSSEFGEGVVREEEQIRMNLNICAKKCNNLIFIYPPHFTSRNAPYGLETIAKDTTNKYVKCFYHDLRRKAFGYAGIWPSGYVYIPKFQDRFYQDLPNSKWSDYRKNNFEVRKSDFDSLLEETYEKKKDIWIDKVRNMESGVRNKKKEEIAEELSRDERFLSFRSNGEREAYFQLLINRGKVMEMAKSEYATVINMAKVLASMQDEELDSISE